MKTICGRKEEILESVDKRKCKVMDFCPGLHFRWAVVQIMMGDKFDLVGSILYFDTYLAPWWLRIYDPNTVDPRLPM